LSLKFNLNTEFNIFVKTKTQTMKKFVFFISALSFFVMVSCNNEKKETEKKQESKDTLVKDTVTEVYEMCDYPDSVEILKIDGKDFDAGFTNVFSNLYVGMSYRIIFTNYDLSEFSDFGDLKKGQVKMVIGLFEPEGGEFKPGKYTYDGENNKVAFTLQVGDRNIYHNIEGIKNPGEVEITSVNKGKICGTAHLMGTGGNEIKVSFGAEQVDLKPVL